MESSGERGGGLKAAAAPPAASTALYLLISHVVAFSLQRIGLQNSATGSSVPPDLPESLGWAEGRDSELVRDSFAFLLEREPATSILSRFSLDVIGTYFPEYAQDMARRATEAH